MKGKSNLLVKKQLARQRNKLNAAGKTHRTDIDEEGDADQID
jgi:hypothetical protein